jgi:hypothetical protein
MCSASSNAEVRDEYYPAIETNSQADFSRLLRRTFVESRRMAAAIAKSMHG